jgi:hypothetical protein
VKPAVLKFLNPGMTRLDMTWLDIGPKEPS